MDNGNNIDTLAKNNIGFTKKMRMASQIINRINCLCDAKSRKELEQNTTEFSDFALRLSQIVGEEVVIEGITIVETGTVRIVRDEENSFPYLYEIRTGPFCANSYYIYEGINYCRCPFYANKVTHNCSEFMCPHLFAVLFAKACNLLKPERVENAKVMEAILQAISTPPTEADPELERISELESKMFSVSEDEAAKEGNSSEPEDL